MAEQNSKRETISKQMDRISISQSGYGRLRIPKTADKSYLNNTLINKHEFNTIGSTNDYKQHKLVHRVFVNGWSDCIKTNMMKSHETYFRIMGHEDVIK